MLAILSTIGATSPWTRAAPITNTRIQKSASQAEFAFALANKRFDVAMSVTAPSSVSDSLLLVKISDLMLIAKKINGNSHDECWRHRGLASNAQFSAESERHIFFPILGRLRLPLNVAFAKVRTGQAGPILNTLLPPRGSWR